MWTPWRRSQQKKMIQQFGQDRPYTKDMHIVEETSHRLVFLCDDMKRGHAGFDKIKNISKPVSRGFTQLEFDYRVGKYTGKALPFMTNQGLKVKGQLHAVASKDIPVLDNHYRNGVEFARVRTNIIIVDRNNVMMSIGNEEFVKNLPPGRLLTSHHTRMYIGDEPRRCVIEAYMYVAMKLHWDDEDFISFPRPRPEFPRDNLIWLPKYYNYPAERNKCK